jgi:hypothetical protein
MIKATKKNTKSLDINQQGANALLAATFDFLRRNNISDKFILDFAKKSPRERSGKKESRLLSDLIRASENMGVVMATWFSNPKFLDSAGNPLPLSVQRGPRSLGSLLRVSRTQVELPVALNLMRQSPSITFRKDGLSLALKRVFVLPKLEVPRAAFVVERYLGTLQRNAAARRKAMPLLLERSCHVSKVDLATIAPLLRDIEGRGTAFMDSIDGEIENRRLRQTNRNTVGEMGVLVFAWTRPNKKRTKSKKAHRNQTAHPKLNRTSNRSIHRLPAFKQRSMTGRRKVVATASTSA